MASLRSRSGSSLGSREIPRDVLPAIRMTCASYYAAFGQRVTIKEQNGRRYTITKLEAAVTQLPNEAAKGNFASLKKLLAGRSAGYRQGPAATPADRQFHRRGMKKRPGQGPHVGP